MLLDHPHIFVYLYSNFRRCSLARAVTSNPELFLPQCGVIYGPEDIQFSALSHMLRDSFRLLESFELSSVDNIVKF